jgi:predicted esterase
MEVTLKKIAWSVCPIIWLLFILSGLPLLAQPAEGLKILQTEKAFTIDGDLEDWMALDALPIQFTPEGRLLPPSADLTVTARFSFDAGYFYAAFSVLDDNIEFPGKGRIEGDGFYLTFADPAATRDESDRSLTFGFSRFENEPLVVLVQRDDFSPTVARDVQFQIKEGKDGQSVAYELAIPWKYIPYFRPFINPSWAVNLTYDDLDAGQKKVVQLVPDPDYEPENPAPKKALPCEFVIGPPKQLEFQSSLNANHFYSEDERELKLAIHSPTSEQGWQVRVIATTSLGNFSSERALSFDEGMSIHSFPIEMEKSTTGVFDVSLGILDDRGKLRYTDDSRFFLLDREQFEGYAAKISELKTGELASKDSVFRESLPTVEIRLQWIKEFMEKSPPVADLQKVQQWNQDVNDLFRKLDEGKPALFPTGRIVRLGYRSEADGSLRSYSVLVPDWYDRGIALPLLVSLSRRGAGSRIGLVSQAPSSFNPRGGRKKAGDFFILTPEVDNPSSWYIGADGQRVIETIEHLKKIYSVDTGHIILDGFGRGGYGALRLALQNPGVYKGVIIRSGQLIPPENSGAESIQDMMDRAKGLSILIIHSDQDRDMPVDEIRGLVTRLQEHHANVRFIEVKGAGPAGYDKSSQVLDWLRDILGDSVVELKPPKKEKEKDKEPDKKK